jgi:DNA polymerase-1
MKLEAINQQGYQLLHEGVEELARIEASGIRIDVPLLQKTKAGVTDKLKEIRRDLEADELWAHWRKRYGANTNLAARDQRAYIIYNVLKVPKSRFTETGLASTDDVVLEKIDHPFIRNLSKWSKYEKAFGTFIKGIDWELVGDRIHPSFDLHTARTFRSSSSSPNFQNLPVRDKDIATHVRSLFIASPGCVLGENDFKGIEVGISCCYHKDPNFIDYISTPGKDMHRDMAAQCYMLEEFLGQKDGISKDARYGAKNKFVFPEFYGAWYKQCAKDMWEWIGKGKLTRPDGASLYQHLKEKGIRGLGRCDPDEDPVKGTFEWHLKEVEKDFWTNRFGDYAQWKRDWYQSYLTNGYFDLLSGFRISGVYDRKQVCNYPIQGSAFHCLLWCLVQINRRLRKDGMKAMIIGQIHDSLLGDIPTKELRTYMHIVEDVVNIDLHKHFPWIKVPLEIEFELSAPGTSWNDKREYKFKNAQFKHPTEDVWTKDTDTFLKAFSASNPPPRPHLEPRVGHRSSFEVNKMRIRLNKDQ